MALKDVLLTALFNPVVVLVAVAMGRKANQWQKLPVAAFAAAMAGWLALYVAVWLNWAGTSAIGRAAAGVLAVQFVIGLAWATIAYSLRRSRP